MEGREGKGDGRGWEKGEGKGGGRDLAPRKKFLAPPLQHTVVLTAN